MIRTGPIRRTKPETWPRLAAYDLARVGVLLTKGGLLKCAACGETWEVRRTRDGSLLAFGFWVCPTCGPLKPPRLECPYNH